SRPATRTLPALRLFAYTTLFRSLIAVLCHHKAEVIARRVDGIPEVYGLGKPCCPDLRFEDVQSAHPRLSVRRIEKGVFVHRGEQDRKSTRLNSSHVSISYAVFCL